VFEKVVVIDCAGHLLGRLASVIAKELLSGQRIVCVRTEEINISGSLFRNKLIFAKFLQKRNNTNPRRGPFHYRAPAAILWRTVRGMLPHKKVRGAIALGKLKSFEGIPKPYDRKKRKVVPQALRVLRLKPNRKFCRLGDLSKSVGWAFDAVIKKFEEKRKKRSASFYAKKKQDMTLKVKALTNIDAALAKLPKQFGMGELPPAPRSGITVPVKKVPMTAEQKLEKEKGKKDKKKATEKKVFVKKTEEKKAEGREGGEEGEVEEFALEALF